MNSIFTRDRYRILLLEDSPEQRILVRVLLDEIADISFELTEATRLSEGLDLLRERTFDLALVDLSLPDAQGLSAVSQVNTFCPGVPVVVLTGMDDEMTAINAIREGAEDYVVKDDVTSSLLKRVILHALQRHWVGQALASSKERVLEAQKIEALGRMASGIVQDFSNLLSGIMGFSEILMRELKDSPLQSEVSEILRAGERASQLTKQILAFSRRDQLIAEPLDLNEVISDFQKMLSRLLPWNVTLDLDLAEPLPQVLVERGQLEQVVLNLVVNARDAMENGGRIRVITGLSKPHPSESLVSELEPTDTYVCLKVIDSGCGIPEYLHRRIFDPFFTTKPSGEGTGLGLFTVYGIVRTAGGSVSVVSAPGRGSIFSVYFPLAECGTTAVGEIDRIQNQMLQRELDARSPMEPEAKSNVALAVPALLATESPVSESGNQKANVKRQLEHLEYVLSHDLQEPVRMVNSYLGLLSRRLSEDLTDETTEFLEIARDGGARLQTMIQGILKLSRLNRAESVAPTASTKDAFEMLKGRFDQDRLRWSGPHALVPMTPVHLLELFTELVDNGFKFQAPGQNGEVVLYLRTTENDRRIVVENEGVGIPEGCLSRCTELFGRLHTRDEFEGVGFGLCYCYNLLEKYGARIELQRTETGARVECVFTVFEEAVR